jgi:hypothetical protein
MLILEIVLTIAAYRRGWKGYALLPGALALLAGFLVGLAAQANGGTAAATPAAILVDIACIVALIVMARRAPAGQSESTTSSPTLGAKVPHAAAQLR